LKENKNRREQAQASLRFAASIPLTEAEQSS
jgi:formiminotetrahydrofolate cyclodeaminase